MKIENLRRMFLVIFTLLLPPKVPIFPNQINKLNAPPHFIKTSFTEINVTAYIIRSYKLQF